MDAWITAADVLGCPQCVEDLLPVVSDAQIGSAIAVASEVLHNAGARQHGLYPIKIRPCCSNCLPPNLNRNNRFYWWGSTFPLVDLIDGLWYNVGVFGATNPCLVWDCGPTRVPQLDLGVTYVDSITEVKIAGVALDPSAYRLDNHRWLVRTDGQHWPITQDFTVDDSATGGWSVTMVVGRPPTPLGRRAATELACQLLLREVRRDKCCLPDRVTRQNRLGVTTVSSDLTAIVEKGGIGLYECDLYVANVNPSKLRAPSRVVLPRRRGH